VWTFVGPANGSGDRTVRVVVTDVWGASAEASWDITLLAPPPDGGGDGGGDGDGTGDGDGDGKVTGVPARESYVPLLLVALIILVVALVALRLAGRDRPPG
jgi:hypothetical protein